MSTLDSIKRFSVKEVLQLPLGDVVNHSIPLSADLASLFPDIAGFLGTIEIEMTHIDQGVQVMLEVKAHGSMPCSRCAKDSRVDVDQSYSMTYSEQKDVGDDLISARHTVDLTQQCIDTVVPAIPDRILCQQDCRGLCSVCGVNLNDEPNHFSSHPEHQQTAQLGNSIRIK